MLLGKQVSNIQATVEGQATELRAELERATDMLTFALIAVAALATFAVVVAVVGSGHE